MRTFQYSDAKSHKFWNIVVQGNAFTVTYGKVGSAGQTTTKSFPTADKAQAEADKLIKEKTGKGYVETTPKAVVSDAEALERAIVANPDDVAAWGAYADYLTEQGDPRGEFMQVQLALEDESRPAADRKAQQAREKALLKKHEREWLGALAAVLLDAEPVPYWDGRKQKTRPPVAHRFERGWLAALTFYELTVDRARAVRAPEARLLRGLAVERVEAENPVGVTEQYVDRHYAPGPDVPEGINAYDDPGLHALCRCPNLGAVRVFRLGASTIGPDGKEEEYMNCHMSGELAYHLVKQMPNVEELYLLAHRVDADKIFALPMPRLRVLQLYHSNKYPLDKLAANKSLTNLTTLLCHPHALDFDDDQSGAYIRLPHLKAICRSPHLTGLTHLRLRLTDFGDKGAKEIAESGILKRLRVLDLSLGCMTDDGAEALAKCPDLKNLEFLDLSQNALSPDGVKAIQATRVKANVGSQHGETGPRDGEMPEYLSMGDIE